MMRYAYRIVDRRADYFRKAADYIARDSLSHYTRAERGRVIQADLFDVRARAYEREAMGTSESEKSWAISGAF